MMDVLLGLAEWKKILEVRDWKSHGVPDAFFGEENGNWILMFMPDVK